MRFRLTLAEGARYNKRMSNIVCMWCKRYTYQVLDRDTELAHLIFCEAYQNQPDDEISNGKEYCILPGSPSVLVELIRPRST